MLLALAYWPRQASAQQSKAEAQINELEKRRFAAQVGKDAATLNQILADDLVYVHSSGTVENKAEFVANVLAGKLVYGKIEVERAQVRFFGSVAVVTGTANMEVSAQGKAQTLRLHYTDVYAKRKGRWQMVSWQSTRLTP